MQGPIDLAGDRISGNPNCERAFGSRDHGNVRDRSINVGASPDQIEFDFPKAIGKLKIHGHVSLGHSQHVVDEPCYHPHSCTIGCDHSPVDFVSSCDFSFVNQVHTIPNDRDIDVIHANRIKFLDHLKRIDLLTPFTGFRVRHMSVVLGEVTELAFDSDRLH